MDRVAESRPGSRGFPDVLMLAHPRPLYSALRRTDPSSHKIDADLVSVRRYARADDQELQTVVQKFSRTIRKCHRRQIHWPSEDDGNSCNFEEYCQNSFVRPVLGLLNQLNNRKVGPTLEPQVLLSTSDVLLVGIRAGREEHMTCPLVVAFLHFASLRDIGVHQNPSTKLRDLFQPAWNLDPGLRIIATDFESAYIASCFSKDSPEVQISDLGLRGNLCALRVILAAYLHVSLPEDLNMRAPKPPNEFSSRFPRGPHIARAPLESDEAIFATHHRHSDFEFHSVFIRRDRALQFFRWKQHILSNLNPVFAHAGDELLGNTLRFSRLYLNITSCFTLEDLPYETVRHMESVCRPLSQKATMDAVMSSDRFGLELLDDTTVDKSGDRMCRTYRCRITSVDGHDLPLEQSPRLFLKLFDDRFHLMEGSDDDLPLLWWWNDYVTAEEQVRSEDSAYKRLHLLQGSLIPHYYGAHSFTLPDGHEIFGILMEDVEAPCLSQGADLLSPQHQVQLTQSVRHAVRALQYADVSQHDWHTEQILWKTVTSDDGSTQVHCILVDFAATSQSVDDTETSTEDDVLLALRVLLDPDVGLDGELVYSSWAPRETWDTSPGFSVKVNGERRTIPLQPDPFQFVYTHLHEEDG